MRITALIPARGGSKSIPRKNIRPLAGKPLIAHAAEAAHAVAAIDDVILATDDDEIAAVAAGLGLSRLSVFRRSPATSTDEASTESVVAEVLAAHDTDLVVLMQATSPLTTPADIAGALARLADLRADSLVTVARQKRFFWETGADGLSRPLNYTPAARPRRQEFAGQLVENGAFYIFSKAGFLASGCRLHGRMAAFEMAPETLTEIDDPDDWLVVEKLMAHRRGRRTLRPGPGGSAWCSPTSTACSPTPACIIRRPATS
ncbi:cytidylyltransferase domain-containing protein [Methylobrevis pamukkalensis]|uniref:CMP-N,N'-diacetyllegionaminic acid synthase n=1 Tax=Methylobrevis pamukkalensis TaxID=1439726 RepID=A0A1E3H6Y8_9HYPH|nr:acylneuraminate cytidylyltransferase family protein [Methylobrevis pamukkalensis]ODN71915.1 CMP-N,N'-diacetyllegionaminic acid synthase [Methylobrevis pamukkalensis]